MRVATGVKTLTQSNSSRLSQAGTQDREVPRPDPAADPRWEAAIRARGTGTPIIRDDPGTGAIASSATDGTIHSPAASGATVGSGTQSCCHEDTDQSTRTGDCSGGSDSRDTRSDRTRSRSGRSRSHSTRSNHRESLDWSIYHRTSALASKCKLT